jgi:hypothetical protein
MTVATTEPTKYAGYRVGFFLEQDAFHLQNGSIPQLRPRTPRIHL